MRVVKAGDDRLEQILQLYNLAFPEEEKLPFDLLMEKRKVGKVEFLAVEDEGEFVGLSIMGYDKDLALLIYFAIAQDKRDMGYGGKALELIKEYHKNYRFFLEIEDVSTPAPNSVDRIRRRKFYINHDMIPSDFFVMYFGTKMEILVASNSLSYDEYYSLYYNIFGDYVLNQIAPIN